MDDIKLALLGNKEVAQRLTDAGVLMPCPFCGNDAVVHEVEAQPRYAETKKRFRKEQESFDALVIQVGKSILSIGKKNISHNALIVLAAAGL